MKSRKNIIFMTILMAGGVLSVATVPAWADSVNFTLLQPVQGTVPGSTLTFEATISAPGTNGGNVFLNGDSFNLGGGLQFDDTGFFVNFPADLAPGQSVTDVLFTVDVPTDSGVGEFDGTFTLLGGSSSSSEDVLASANFQIATTPEPSSLLLLGTGLAGFATAVRRRWQICDSENQAEGVNL